MKFCELTREEYDSFQKNHFYRNFLNDVETMDLEKMKGYSCQLVGVKENEQIFAAALLVSFPMIRGKFHFYYAPRGFLIDYENKTLFQFFTDELKKYAKKKKAIYITVDPYVRYLERDCDGKVVENGFDHRYFIQLMNKNGYEHKGFGLGFGQNMQDFRWMYTMSLKDKTKDDIWKGLNSQARRSINRIDKYKIKVKELTIDELSVFDDIMKATANRRHFATRPLSFYQNQMKAYKEHLKVALAYMDAKSYHQSLIDDLKHEQEAYARIENELQVNTDSKKQIKKLNTTKENIEILNKRIHEAIDLIANYGEMIPMAASEFVFYGDEVIYLISGAYEQFRNYPASYALQWYMIQKGIEEGYPVYNFNGITGNFDESSVDYGVYQFKRGFAGQCEELVGDFILPTRPLLYKIYKLLK